MVSVDQINKNLSISSLETVWERGKLWAHKCTFHRHPWCTLVLWLDVTEVTKSDSISISVGRLWRERSHDQDPSFCATTVQQWKYRVVTRNYHQSSGHTVVKPYQPFETLVVPRSEGTTKTMIQSLDTESALLRWCSCDAHAFRIYACTGVRRTVHSRSSSNLPPTHPTLSTVNILTWYK